MRNLFKWEFKRDGKRRYAAWFLGLWIAQSHLQAATIASSANHVPLTGTVALTVDFGPNDPDLFSYHWRCDAGGILGGGKTVTFQAPASPGTVPIQVDVQQGATKVAQASIRVLVWRAFIVVKADDLVHLTPGWQTWWNYMAQEAKVKASVGIETFSLPGSAAYRQAIVAQARTGFFEFWHHGYTHVHYPTMPRETQLEHLRTGSQLAEQHLGLVLRGFGAPMNTYNADTVWAMNQCPNLEYWLYGPPYNGLTLNDRLPAETSTTKADYDFFVSNYRSTGGRKCRVTQIHPANWDDSSAGLANWRRIIDFLKSEQVTFILPYEYVRLLREPTYIPPDPSQPDTVPPPPSPPLTLQAQALSDGGVALTWTCAAENETGFRIERLQDRVGFLCAGAAEANATTYIEEGLVPNATYSYRVVAFNPGGDSEASPTASVTLPPGKAAPTATELDYFRAVNVGERQVALDWRTVVEVHALGFYVLRETPEGAWERITPDLIPAEGLNDLPQAYRFDDRNAPQVAGLRYRLIGINLSGEERLLAEAAPVERTALRIAQREAGIALELQGAPGKVVTLQATPGLGVEPWSAVETITLDDQGMATVRLPFEDGPAARFYRLAD